MATFKGNILRSFGKHRKANEADAEGEERRLLAAEHRKPENRRPRKVTYHEIMEELATGQPGRFLDRKIQSLIASDMWPPQSFAETFDRVRESGQDNAWTTSLPGIEKLIMVGYPQVYLTINIQFGPARATFALDGIRYKVQGKTPVMALMAVHLTCTRIRHPADDGTTGLGPHVEVLGAYEDQ
ncbi:hypothetical protein ACQZ6V_23650 [Agrobacterium sp. 22-3674b3]